MMKFDWYVVIAVTIAAVVFAVLGMWDWCVTECLFVIIYWLTAPTVNRLLERWMTTRHRSQS